MFKVPTGYFLKRFFCLIVCNVSFLVMSAQEDYFGDISANGKVAEKWGWNMSVSGTYKQYFSEHGWTRLQTNILVDKTWNVWSLHGGIVLRYTFDKEISNYWEVRPWAGISLVNKVITNLSFDQYFRAEWRNLIFTDDSPNKITSRARYRIRPSYTFPNKTGINRWGVRTSYEWYIVPNNDLNARFISSKEFSMEIFKEINQKYKLFLSYSRDTFNVEFNPGAKNGNTFGLLFAF